MSDGLCLLCETCGRWLHSYNEGRLHIRSHINCEGMAIYPVVCRLCWTTHDWLRDAVQCYQNCMAARAVERPHDQAGSSQQAGPSHSHAGLRRDNLNHSGAAMGAPPRQMAAPRPDSARTIAAHTWFPAQVVRSKVVTRARADSTTGPSEHTSSSESSDEN
ncbi:uncharacterized protein LOC117651043 isoform X2 [Thrips palmi]|nr:uncharacterized protein LOC117651043 isoform X2 [Thrips palmi]